MTGVKTVTWLAVVAALAAGCGQTSSPEDASSQSSGSGGTNATGGAGGEGGSEGSVGGTGGMQADLDIGRSVFEVGDLSALSGMRFFDHPWPSDLRFVDGAVVLEGYPNPRSVGLIDSYVEVLAGRLDGFSPAATGFMRFTVPLDTALLPLDPIDSVDVASSVQLINIDTGSDALAERSMISVSFRAEPGVYIPANTLAFHPVHGQPLLGRTRYALVVTDRVRDTSGAALRRAPALEDLVSGTGPDTYLEALVILEEIGVDPQSILNLAVFTTSGPTELAVRVRDHLTDSFEAPEIDAASWVQAEHLPGSYEAYEGRAGPFPDYQQGTPPFISPDAGGDIAFDASGDPEVAREFELRFALALPEEALCAEPPDGYPAVLIAHGTGGNYKSALGSGLEADQFAAECLATLSIDQIYHGERPGAEVPSAELLYFNLQNPLSARSNGLQSAMDFVQLARLVRQTTVALPATVSVFGVERRLDPGRVMLFGHSQGGLNGPIALAVDDSYRGGVLSGAAGSIALVLLEKKAPIDFSDLLATTFLGLDAVEGAEVDAFHPALSLVQLIADPSDPMHYAPKIVLAPRPGFAPKSLLMTEGVRPDGTGDSYAPPRAIESLAVATGLPLRAPAIGPTDLFDWAGLNLLDLPATGTSGNLADGLASGALLQFDADLASDGHFVFYDIPAAGRQSAAFLRALADQPEGSVPGP